MALGEHQFLRVILQFREISLVLVWSARGVNFFGGRFGDPRRRGGRLSFEVVVDGGVRGKRLPTGRRAAELRSHVPRRWARYRACSSSTFNQDQGDKHVARLLPSSSSRRRNVCCGPCCTT